MTLEDRLIRRGWTVTPSGCWELHTSGRPNGYQRLNIGQRHLLAHRLAYELWVGPIPQDAVIRHKCDNPPCINPAPPESGTQTDNVGDREKRGRTSRGSRHYAARLTDVEVAEIRSGYETGLVSQSRLAELYGVGQAHISKIVRKTKWRE